MGLNQADVVKKEGRVSGLASKSRRDPHPAPEGGGQDRACFGVKPGQKGAAGTPGWRWLLGAWPGTPHGDPQVPLGRGGQSGVLDLPREVGVRWD